MTAVQQSRLVTLDRWSPWMALRVKSWFRLDLLAARTFIFTIWFGNNSSLLLGKERKQPRRTKEGTSIAQSLDVPEFQPEGRVANYWYNIEIQFVFFISMIIAYNIRWFDASPSFGNVRYVPRGGSVNCLEKAKKEREGRAGFGNLYQPAQSDLSTSQFLSDSTHLFLFGVFMRRYVLWEAIASILLQCKMKVYYKVVIELILTALRELPRRDMSHPIASLYY